MAISEATLHRAVDFVERADALVRRQGARLRAVPRRDRTLAIARGLGWFGVALGMAEAVASPALARLIGAQGYEKTLRLFGLREIGTGITILGTGKPSAGSMWGRVAGDVMDLALLGVAAAATPARRSRAWFAAAVVFGLAAVDYHCARRLHEPHPGGNP